MFVLNFKKFLILIFEKFCFSNPHWLQHKEIKKKSEQTAVLHVYGIWHRKIMWLNLFYILLKGGNCTSVKFPEISVKLHGISVKLHVIFIYKVFSQHYGFSVNFLEIQSDLEFKTWEFQSTSQVFSQVLEISVILQRKCRTLWEGMMQTVDLSIIIIFFLSRVAPKFTFACNISFHALVKCCYLVVETRSQGLVSKKEILSHNYTPSPTNDSSGGI